MFTNKSFINLDKSLFVFLEKYTGYLKINYLNNI